MLHNYSLACQATSLAPLRVARRRIKKRENEKKKKKKQQNSNNVYPRLVTRGDRTKSLNGQTRKPYYTHGGLSIENIEEHIL